MKQVYNPYLPLNEYIPDAEPHVFGDRVYVYGSHDKEDGETFCMLDYVCYSAAVDDLKEWRYEGVIYRAEQDPDYQVENSKNSPITREYMYAPDVVRGNDGRYYLYYCMSGWAGQGGYHGPIQVAVCDTPAGKYEYLGYVRNPDGTPMLDYVCFDPAAINDDGVIRIYYGTQYPFEEETDFFENEESIRAEMEMFHKSREEILTFARKDSVMGPCMVTLQDDMFTVKEAAKHIIPYKVKGTTFEEHPFFEGSSIRKVKNKYYFVYSSMKNHELCYAVSDHPDRDFVFGGTIVSNGDVGLHGRTEKERLNMTGTTHGGIECINGEWYVFYHRLTHKSDYSRQGCAEKITIDENGKIEQAEMTSCGLNGRPLVAEGVYPAAICCHLTNGSMPHGSNQKLAAHFPHVGSRNNERFIAQLQDHTLIGYKYFAFDSVKALSVTMKSEKDAVMEVYQGIPKDYAVGGETYGTMIGKIEIPASDDWTVTKAEIPFEKGVTPLYLKYIGSGEGSLKEINFFTA